MSEKILCTTSSFGTSAPQALQRLEAAGYEPVVNPHGRKLTEAELLALLQEHAPAGLLAGTEPVTAACMEAAAPALKAISRVGVGWDAVDHDAAKRLGIPVARTEGVLDQCVAELSLGMMLDALRNISRQDREMRAGVWKKRMGALLSGKTVGILGYGAIGQRLGKLLDAFGARVLFHDPCAVEGEVGTSASMEELLRGADILSLHASCAKCLIGPDELAMTRPGVIIVNTARGELIAEAALVEALANGHVGYACLDVFEKEPYQGRLLEFDNVVCTPHVGSYALEARVQMEELAVENLLALLDKEADDGR